MQCTSNAVHFCLYERYILRLRIAMSLRSLDHSTPMIRLKGKSAAHRSARPLPHPKSMKVNSRYSIGRFFRMYLKTFGWVGRDRTTCPGIGCSSYLIDSEAVVLVPYFTSNPSSRVRARRWTKPYRTVSQKPNIL